MHKLCLFITRFMDKLYLCLHDSCISYVSLCVPWIDWRNFFAWQLIKTAESETNTHLSSAFISGQPFWLFREMIYAIRCQTRYRTRWVRHKYYPRDRNAPAFDGIPTCSFDFSLQIKFLKSSSYTSNVNWFCKKLFTLKVTYF